MNQAFVKHERANSFSLADTDVFFISKSFPKAVSDSKLDLETIVDWSDISRPFTNPHPHVYAPYIYQDQLISELYIFLMTNTAHGNHPLYCMF